jgi:hypothetical protein
MDREEPTRGPGTYKRYLLIWVVAVLGLVAALVVGWQAYKAPRGLGLLDTFPKLLQEVPNDEQRVGQIILDSYSEYRADARNWSAVYFGCLFFSAACAALAGVVIKLEFFLKNEGFKKDLAAVLAMMAALLVTLSTAGGFHQHWWANRMAAAKMEKLAYAFMTADRKGSLDAFSSQIQAISYERNEEIGSSDNGTPNQPKTK